MALATLSIDLIAKVGELAAGFDKANRLAEQSANKMQARFQLASAAAVGIGSALAGALSGGAFIGQIKARIDGLSELKSAFDATGSSIENLSGLEDVANRTGTSFETVTTSLIKLNQALNAAKPDTDQAKAIEAIGLSVAGLKKEDPSEAFRQIAVGLAKFADDGNKARVAQLLFGKSLKEVAPLLQNLVDVGELVATVTTKQGLAAEEFTNHLANINKNAVDLGRSLANVLLPPMNRLLEAFKNGGFAGVLSAADNGKLGKALGFDDLNQATIKVKNLEEAIGGIQLRLANPKYNADTRATLSKLLQTRTQELNKAREAVDQLNGTNYGNEGRRVVPERRSIGDVSGKAPKDDAAIKKAESYVESLRKQLEGTQQLTVAEQVLEEIRSGSLKGGTDKAKARARALGIEIDATKEAIRVSRERADLRNKDEQAANDAARDNERTGREEVKALLADTFASKFAKAEQDIQRLNRTFLDATGAFRAGFDPAQYAEAIGQVTVKLADTTVQQLDALTVFADQAARNIQDALGNTLESVLGGNFNNIGKLWSDLLKKMVAQAAAAQLNEAIFGKGGGGGDLIKSLIRAVGSIFGPGVVGTGIPGRAIGGPVKAGAPYLVGENGRELIVPRGDGRVLNAADTQRALAGGGAGVSYSPTTNISISGSNPQETARQVRGMLDERDARLVRSLRNGSLRSV